MSEDKKIQISGDDVESLVEDLEVRYGLQGEIPMGEYEVMIVNNGHKSVLAKATVDELGMLTVHFKDWYGLKMPEENEDGLGVLIQQDI